MTQPWRELHDLSIARLAAAGVDDPEQEVRWIAERASGRTAAEHVVALDEPATEREASFVDQMVSRRAAGEPLQYVLGRWGFRTLDLLVDARVLIPRPETEMVAGLAIDALAALRRSAVAVDLGTGSGAIALSLAAERWPDIEVWATDASSDALAVARANLAGLGRRAGVVRLVEGDWFAALPDDLRGRVDVVVSNPPYVAEGDSLPSAVADWEPATALLAGSDGLADLRRIITGAPDWLTDDGLLVVEIGEAQGDAVLGLAETAGFAEATIERDLAGKPRALVARRAALTVSLDDVELDEAVERIAAALTAGGAVVLPTDTVYGLAALPRDKVASDRLFELKGRGADAPMAVLCADVTQALELADPSVGAAVAAVAARWWPGPLTLVLPRRVGVQFYLGEPSSTVGLRVPDHDVVRAVAAAVGPIAATSANRHGEPTPTTAAEAAAMLGPGVALVVDGGRVAERPSTVIDATADRWTVLREGPIPSVEVIALAHAPTDDGR